MGRTGVTRSLHVIRIATKLIPFTPEFCYNAARFLMGFEPVFYL